MTENLPVNWKDQMKEMAVVDAKKERVQATSISLRAGVMTYMGQALKGNTLDCVVIASAHEKRFFPEKWDPDNIQPPLCWVLSREGIDMAPDATLVTEPKADTCAECPLNEFGSDLNGGRGKACKDVRRLALMPIDGIEKADTADLAMMTIPVTSVKNWAAYVNTVSALHQRPVFGVITKISTIPDVNTQFKVLFEAVSLVGDEYLGALYARREAAMNMLLAPYDKRVDKPEGEAEKPGKKKKY